MMSNDRNLNKEICIEYPLFQSQKGNYFIGQTPILTGIDTYAIAAWVNPPNSNVNSYLNAITVSNISNQNLSAEIYLRSNPSVGEISSYVSCTNVTIIPPPKPNGEIQFKNIVTNPPTNGVLIFSRIVPAFTTTVIDGGQIIIPPYSCILVYLGGFLPVEIDSAIVAFGWWEERLNKYCCDYRSCC